MSRRINNTYFFDNRLFEVINMNKLNMNENKNLTIEEDFKLAVKYHKKNDLQVAIRLKK